MICGWNVSVAQGFDADATTGGDGADLVAFGTTSVGGTALSGVAYELWRNGSGSRMEAILHTFLDPSVGDGANPNGLIFDSQGNLFGTSIAGGTDNPGNHLRDFPGWQWRLAGASAI
jgi:hypothetical protein